MTVIMASGLFAALKPANSETLTGPRAHQLLCKIYPNNINEFIAIRNGRIDVIDTPPTPALVPIVNSTPAVTLPQPPQLQVTSRTSVLDLIVAGRTGLLSTSANVLNEIRYVNMEKALHPSYVAEITKPQAMPNSIFGVTGFGSGIPKND